MERCSTCGLVFARNPGDTWAFTILGDRLPIAAMVAFGNFGVQAGKITCNGFLFDAKNVQYPQVLATLNLGVSSFIVAHGLTVLTTVLLYLLACDPLPPCQGKVHEWLRALVPARHVPAAVPED